MQSEDSQESDDSQEAESESDDTVDSEDESFEPNREKQEHLVQRLKKKLPDLDKEVRPSDPLYSLLQSREGHGTNHI